MPRSIKITLCCLLLVAGVTISVSGAYSFFTFRERGTSYCFAEEGVGYTSEAFPSIRRAWYGAKTLGGVLLAAGSLLYLVALRTSMRKRPGVLPAVLLVAALGGPACHWAFAAAAQPTYQAKPLDWWLSWWSTNRQGAWVSADGPPQRTADLSQCKPALSSIGLAAVPVITRRLRDNKSSEWGSRQAAAYLGDIGSNAVPQLLEAMDDESPAVRLAAALALETYAGNLLPTNETARVFGRALEDKR